jgi:ferritin-like metal-binding protein YciE
VLPDEEQTSRHSTRTTNAGQECAGSSAETSCGDLYDAEKQLVKALPKVAKAASSEHLRQGIQEHLEETKAQVERLEDAFERLEIATRGKRCEAMRCLVDEAVR